MNSFTTTPAVTESHRFAAGGAVVRLAMTALLALAAGLCTEFASAQNLIANPGFETGDFTGWTLSGNLDFVGVDDVAPHSGTFAAFFGPVGSLGFISQDVATVPGTTYEVSFWLNVEPFSEISVFTFDWDAVNQLTLLDLPETPYTTYSFELQAIDASTTVRFGFQNDDSFHDFDDVSVVVVPEPRALSLTAMALVVLAIVAHSVGKKRLPRRSVATGG